MLSCLWVFRCWKVFVLLFGVFVDEVWWPSCAGLRECTRVGYESALRCHVLPRWGGVDLDSVTVADIESWLDSFAKAGAARKAWAVFRSILRLAYRRGVTDNDVTRREIRLPHLRHYEPQVLTAPEVRRLLKGFYGHPLEAWLLVSVCAGLRRCESVGLEWADLDLKRGTVTVKRSVQWVAGHETVTEPKTDLSRRTVALPRFAVKRLAELRHGTKTGRLVGSLNANQVANHYRSWCRRMKLPLRASTQPASHVRHVGDQGRNRYQRGRATARAFRHPNHRTVLPQARSERPQGHAESMAETHIDLLIAFRNPDFD